MGGFGGGMDEDENGVVVVVGVFGDLMGEVEMVG